MTFRIFCCLHDQPLPITATACAIAACVQLHVVPCQHWEVWLCLQRPSSDSLSHRRLLESVNRPQQLLSLMLPLHQRSLIRNTITYIQVSMSKDDIQQLSILKQLSQEFARIQSSSFKFHMPSLAPSCHAVCNDVAAAADVQSRGNGFADECTMEAGACAAQHTCNVVQNAVRVVLLLRKAKQHSLYIEECLCAFC